MSADRPAPVRPRAVAAAERRRRFELALHYPDGNVEPGQLRLLPYPFTGYCTIAGDCDAISMAALRSASIILRERHGLPVSGSVFPQFLFQRGCHVSRHWRPPGALYTDFAADGGFALDRFVGRNGACLRDIFRGRIDTVHGWLLCVFNRIGADQRLSLAPGAVRTHRIPVNFRLPDGWHRRVPPRYLVFRYRNPTGSVATTLEFRHGGTCLTRLPLAPSRDGAPMAAVEYVVDLWQEVTTDMDALKHLEVVLEATGAGGAVDLVAPAMVTWLREDVEEQVRVFDRLNLRMTVYTSHGGGYNIGQFKVASLDAADPRGMAETPETPFYSLDLLRGFGLRFFNTASNTARREPVPLDRLVFAKTLNDGSLAYDFDRFLEHPPQPEDPGRPATDPSLSPWIGWQLRRLLARLNRPGSGGVLYTHFFARPTDDPAFGATAVEDLFDPDTHEALAALADRYYDLSGSGAPRVFVAPTAVLVRLSQMLQGLPGQLDYDAAANVVRVRPWTDPVTGEHLPGDAGGARALRHVTIYVRDAATARLDVAGVDYPYLVRNPADETGRESITVADAGAPTLILGSICASGRPDRPLAKDGVTIAPDKDGGTRLTLSGDRGYLEIGLEGVALADHQAVLVDMAGPMHAVSWQLSLETVDGLRLSAACPPDAAETGAVLAVTAPADPTRHIAVLPFHRLLSSLPSARRHVPVGGLDRVRLILTGPPGSSVLLKELSLLRDETACHPEGFLIGGQVAPEAGIDRVRLRTGTAEEIVPVLEDGWYLFLTRIPNRTVVEVTGLTADGAGRTPHAGARIEVRCNCLEVDFPAPARPTATGLD